MLRRMKKGMMMMRKRRIISISGSRVPQPHKTQALQHTLAVLMEDTGIRRWVQFKALNCQ